VILAVAGGKGGVGRTTLAYNLGAALDAAVVDADLGMADLPAGGDPPRGPDLHDVLAGRASPSECLRGGPVDVVPCGRSLAGARAADLDRLAAVVRRIEAIAGDVVVDCPAGRRADAGVPLAAANRCLLVAAPTAFAVADALRTRDLARDLDAALAAAAVNRVVDPPPTDAVAAALGAPVTAVPADPRLGRSVREAAPVVDAAPDSAAARAVRALADEAA